MIVTRQLFDEVIRELSVPGAYVFDTETTGLDPYKVGDNPFAIIIEGKREPYYFNFLPYQELGEDQADWVLSKPHKAALKRLFKSKHHLWVAHNAKFDWHMLGRLGIFPREIDCTMIRERILQNDRFQYSLAAITGGKDDTVRKFITKKKLFTDVPPVFASKPTRRLHYDKVPLEMMHPYACQDVSATKRLWESQEQRLEKMERIRNEQAPGTPSIRQVLELERRVLPVVCNMERHGIYVNREYAVEAYNYERDRIEKATAEFKALVGAEYDGRDAVLGPLFEGLGHKLGRTADNHYALDANALGRIGGPIAECVLTIRDAEKRKGTFWAGILERVDNQGRLHADFKQTGTATGRFSCADPNLQNLPKRKDDQSAYPIRKAFIPPPGFCLYMPDYEQMEYRLFMDLAGQMDVIEKVLAGTDVHSATAEMIQRDRHIAKTVNFLIIYGGGNGALAEAITVALEEAKRIREGYMDALPMVRRLIERLRQVALQRGWLINWYGRPLRFNRDTYYKAPNYFIQGGCADIVKLAMCKCDRHLAKMKSNIVSQIHDELWFYIHESELYVTPILQDHMALAYPHRYLPMAVDPSHSWVSAHDKAKGHPLAKESA